MTTLLINSLTSILNVVSGHFENVSSPSIPILSFTQQDIDDGLVRFVHDSSELAPSFDMNVFDGTVNTSTTAASIIFSNVNDAPTANDDAYMLMEDQTANITPGVLANDFDVDSVSLTVALETGPTYANQFQLNSDGSFLYVPLTDFSGNDSFTYRVVDEQGASQLAQVFLDVLPINDPPIGKADYYSIFQTSLFDAANGVLSNDSDIESDPLIAILVQPPANGKLTLDPDGSFTYAPDISFWGRRFIQLHSK